MSVWKKVIAAAFASPLALLPRRSIAQIGSYMRSERDGMDGTSCSVKPKTCFTQGSLRVLSGAGVIQSLCIAAVISVAGLGQAQAQSGKPLVKVRYEEVIRSVLYLPSYIALSQGYFKDVGLDVTMRTSQGTDKGMTALLTGSADIVLIGPEAVVYVQNSESPVKTKIFSGLTATDGFMLMSRAPVDKNKPDWSKIKGKTVMGWRPGSNPEVYMQAALRKNGIDPKKDITLVNNIGIPARVGAWLAGQGDYAVFPEPEASTLEKDGKAHFFASVGNEIGPVDYTAFTATDAYIKKNPQVVQAWTNAIARAQKYVHATSSAELAKHIVQFFPGVSQDQMVATIDRYKQYRIWKTTPLVEENAIVRLQDMLIASGVLENDKRVKYNDVVTTEFAKQVK
jgi:NitT/TauT family transport system substrate-binding protein